MEHLELDDIIEYIYADTMDSSTALLAQRVNAHIMRCDKCKRIYNLVNSLYDYTHESGTGDIKELWKNLVTFKVEEGARLVLNYLSNNLLNYYYPMVLGARGTNTSVEDTSMIVDEDNELNSIRIDSGIMEFSIDADEYENDVSMVAVVDEEGNIQCIEQLELVEHCYVARLNIDNGTYTIFIG